MVETQAREQEREPTPRAGEEEDLRQTLAAFEEAIRARDLERIMRFYAPDMIAYDMLPPLHYSGRDAYRKSWEKGVAMMEEGFESEMRELHVEASGDIGFAHGLCRMKNGGNEMWMRWSGGFKKQGGNWLIVHEHVSVPVDVESGKALMDLKPEEQLH